LYSFDATGEGGDEGKSDVIHEEGMTEDDWLQWRKQGRAKQILFIYRRQDFSYVCVCASL
jgi:hypothetical protein